MNQSPQKATRPKIKLPITSVDRGVEIVGVLLIIAVWFYTASCYRQLPETVPIHFNGAGEADRFGNKKHLFELPLIATIIYAALSVLNKYPHLFNYPTRITQENAKRQYQLATRLLRYLKLLIVLIFGGIVWLVFQSTGNNNHTMHTWFLPIVIALIALPLLAYMIASVRKSSTQAL